MDRREFNKKLASAATALAVKDGFAKTLSFQNGQVGQSNSDSININGQPVITLHRTQTGNRTQPEFLSATVIPGRGMNLFQATAYLPGKGETALFMSPSLEEAAKLLTGVGVDAYGDKSHAFGGAFLVPFANRIRGQVAPDGKTITARWNGKDITLAANRGGMALHIEPHALHGLIMKTQTTRLTRARTADGETVVGEIDAGDYGGHWFSKSNIAITVALSGKALDISVVVKNVGDTDEPVGIGWHPYFAIPSGDLTQVKVYISGTKRVEVDNYQDVFPTGTLIPVKGTAYDFSKKGGAPVQAAPHSFDDCYVDLKKDADASSITEMIDPAAHIGMRLTSLSREISAIQLGCQPAGQHVCLEPQFNWADPFGKEWKGQDTHMVTLHPAQSVTWKVRMELFVLDHEEPA